MLGTAGLGKQICAPCMCACLTVKLWLPAVALAIGLLRLTG